MLVLRLKSKEPQVVTGGTVSFGYGPLYSSGLIFDIWVFIGSSVPHAPDK